MEPKNEAELAGMITAAEGPLAIQGGGTRGVAARGEVLSAAGLSGVELYEPGALTLVARAGTPVAKIEAVLAEHNQRMAFEPMDHRGLVGSLGTPTIGGVIAGNISGPRRVQVGAARDFLLGVRFVDGRGQVIRNGGRVMKNVTGYDLVKLLAGSWGTLGVLSEVALKVLPMAETQASVLVEVSGVGAAVGVMSRALGSPFEVSGAAFDPAASVVMLRVEGFEASVAYRLGRLKDLLGDAGEVSFTGSSEQSELLWRAVRDVDVFQRRMGDVWRLSVKPSQAPEVVARLEADGLLFDWGGGLIWALMPEGVDLRQRTGEFAGHATLVRASEETKARLGVFHPLPAPLRVIGDGIRKRFDPKGILNAGLMQPGTGVAI